MVLVATDRARSSRALAQVWAALARLLTHVYLRTESPSGPPAAALRGAPMLRAMGTCHAQLRALCDDDANHNEADPEATGGAAARSAAPRAARVLTRAILPAIACYTGGAAQRLVVSSRAPQRALLSLLHQALLELAAYHVAVGLRGLKCASTTRPSAPHPRLSPPG